MHDKVSELPAMTRLLFIGLWTQADRDGRLYDNPKRIKAYLFPYDNFDVEKGLQLLFESGFIIRYKVEGCNLECCSFIQIVNWLKHQKIDKVNEKESLIPELLEKDYQKTITSLVKVEEGKGRERKGKEGKEVGFQPPTLAEVILYFLENGFPEATAKRAFNYYSVANWKDSKGNQVKNWRQKMQAVWFKEENKEEKSSAKKEESGFNDLKEQGFRMIQLQEKYGTDTNY
jgi:hypothetical protein